MTENIFSSFPDGAARFFAFQLGRGERDSSFTIGELDGAFANSTADLVYNAVWTAKADTYDYWKLPLQRLTLNGTSFYLGRSRFAHAPAPIAVLDTGTTLVLGPSADVDRFWESVGGAEKTADGWRVPCSRAVSLGLVLGTGDSEQEYALDPADVSWKAAASGDGWCLGGVQANDGVRISHFGAGTIVPSSSRTSAQGRCPRRIPSARQPLLAPASRIPCAFLSDTSC